METANQGDGGMQMMMFIAGGGGTYYKNVKDKSYTADKEVLIKDSIPNLQWKTTGDCLV